MVTSFLYVFSNGTLHWKSQFDWSPTDDLDDLDVNAAFWDIFMNTTLQAAVHLVSDFLENLRFIENESLS